MIRAIDEGSDGRDILDDVEGRTEGGTVETVRPEVISESGNWPRDKTYGMASRSCLTVKLGRINLSLSAVASRA